MNIRFFALLSLLILAGCAGNPSKEASLLLIDQIDEYEESIKMKVDAEQTFYGEIRATLQNTAGRQAWFEHQAEIRNRITQLTDRAIVVDKGLQVSLLQKFLREENDRARTRKAREDQLRAELEENYRVSFDSLNFRRQQLTVTRNKLLTLTQDQEIKKELISRIQEAAVMARKLNEEAEQKIE